MGRRLGDADDPLLVSVRSGAKFSMPGMMETVLNVGLNDESVHGLAPAASDERFALDSYRRLLQMFGSTVLGHRRRAVRRRARRRSRRRTGVDRRPRPRRRRPRGAGRDLQGAHRASTPVATSRRTRASSSTSPSARSSTPGTPTAPSSTAARSGSPRTSAPRSTCRRWCSATAGRTPAPGSASPATRPPAPRACTATTCRTPRARTSSPASATPCRWPTWQRSTRRRYDELLAIMATLEQHYRDMCDIEFTIERGKLWMLQTRVGKRTPEAAFRIARAHGRRGPHRPGRGAAPGHRRPARAADVPALRRQGRARPARRRA